MKVYDFVKRLGDWHLADSLNSNGKTLCGMPMLSNNYAGDYMKPGNRDKLKKCQKCFEIYEKSTTPQPKKGS